LSTVSMPWSQCRTKTKPSKSRFCAWQDKILLCICVWPVQWLSHCLCLPLWAR